VPPHTEGTGFVPIRGSEGNQSEVRSGPPLLKRLLPLLASVLLSGLVVGGIVTVIRRSTSKPSAHIPVSREPGGSDDDSTIFSGAREAPHEAKPAPSAQAQSGQGIAAAAATAKQKELAAQQAAADAAQRSAQEAMLAAKQQELERKAAEQADREKLIEQERLGVEAEKQKAQEAAAEAERAKQAAAAPPRPAAYSGPTSGTIVWQGAVKGTTLVTINGKSSDIGEIVSGALPGVLVMIQPADTKHVGVASAPAPSNSYQRLTLRVQGNGVLQETIRWSIP
jgi:hypothetical protein